MTSRLFTFIVAGNGAFPFNMLFRNRCWPATLHDAELMELACPTQAPRQAIRFQSYQIPLGAMWTEYKWPVQRVEG